MRALGSESTAQPLQMTLRSPEFREPSPRTVRLAFHEVEHATGAEFLGGNSRTDSKPYFRKIGGVSLTRQVWCLHGMRPGA